MAYLDALSNQAHRNPTTNLWCGGTFSLHSYTLGQNYPARVPRTVLDGMRADIFARVTRAPGHFGIITQEFRFPTLYTNRTVIMDRHDEKQYCHRACPSCLSGLLTNRTGTMAYPNLTQKSFMEWYATLWAPQETFLGQIWVSHRACPVC